jgi:hypothetical protein
MPDLQDKGLCGKGSIPAVLIFFTFFQDPAGYEATGINKRTNLKT